MEHSNLTNLYQVFNNFDTHTDDYLGSMFINIFHEFPRAYRIYYDKNGDLTYQEAVESFQEARENINKKIDTRKLIKNILKEYDSLNLIYQNKTKGYMPDDISDITENILFGGEIFAYSPHEYLVLGDGKVNKEHYPFLMNLTLSEDGEMADYYEEIFCKPTHIEYIFKNIKKYFECSNKEEKIDFGIAAVDSMGHIYTTYYDYKLFDIDINKNYNDDFPPVYDKICSIVESNDKSSLMLFYGEPGTGKTSVIKHLISKYPGKDFVFIDDQLLMNASPEKLVSYFLESQNHIFILEDCEKVLSSRDKGYNPIISTILNLSDGIISDVLGIKLICTFNTNLNNIDKALLRKGRLSLKYEFKKLKKEKVKALIGDDNINEDMALADIYNYKEENDFSKQTIKRIGF